ncbi:hypothetical protein KY289_001627 [Solanum tuberosum]|nr:hypothetical protein KY289_001627 [Solanum tuberosum]
MKEMNERKRRSGAVAMGGADEGQGERKSSGGAGGLFGVSLVSAGKNRGDRGRGREEKKPRRWLEQRRGDGWVWWFVW